VCEVLSRLPRDESQVAVGAACSVDADDIRSSPLPVTYQRDSQEEQGDLLDTEGWLG
jgi:hypothetical protein